MHRDQIINEICSVTAHSQSTWDTNSKCIIGIGIFDNYHNSHTGSLAKEERVGTVEIGK